MTKAAVKERADEPVLFAQMKDVTPKKKGDDKKPEPEKDRKVQGGYTAPSGGKKPNPPKTGTGVVPAKPQRAAAKSAADKVRAESKSIIEIAKECAMNPLVDAGKMREVIAMAREEQNRIDDRVFQLAKMEVQNQIPPITRDSLNKHTNSKWARLEKISAIADPVIRRHGFSLSYGSADCPLANHYRITCDVTHTPTGYTKHYWIDVGMDAEGAKGGGTKSLAQGSGSSVTYARRFLKVMIFDINIVGEDFDGRRFTVEPKHVDRSNGAETETGNPKGSRPNAAAAAAPAYAVDPNVPKITKAQENQVLDAIDDCGVSHKKFKTNYQINEIADLPLAMFGEALRACADYKANQARKK